MRCINRVLSLLTGLYLSLASTWLFAQHTAVSVVYVDVEREITAGVPDYLVRPASEGYEGASIAIEDANITGKFVGYKMALSVVTKSQASPWQPDAVDTLKQASVIIVDSPTSHYQDIVQQLAAVNSSALLFNVANYTSAARALHCNARLLHTAPTYQMKTDALGQWFRTKRISDVFVLKGKHPDDDAYANAFMQTAKKFKLDVVEVKQWQDSFDLRRSAFSEIPMFTRTADRYQAVFAADTTRQFAYSLPFNTQYQVPVTGDAGLNPENWHHTHEQWGARQLQNRFKDVYARPMNNIDYAAYVAVIAVASVLQQGAASNGSALYEALLSEDTAIAAYKGRKLSFRTTTRQLRQPILPAQPEALITQAPLPGFLHQTNDLDTLGSMKPTCQGNRS